MAKVYSPPESIPAPVFDYSSGIEQLDKQAEAYRTKLREFCEKHGNGKPEVGKTIRFSVADGYAEYMVFKTSPLSLIHIPLLDAYQIAAPYARGLRLGDVRENIKHQEAMAKLFGGRS